jgi:hypothetical protein
MSRKTRGSEHVEGLDGSEQAKGRLREVLRAIAGEITVEEACRALSVSEARFHELRRQALLGAIEALEPKAAGRPPAPRPTAEVEALLRENEELRFRLEAAQTRTEIALVMPEVLLRPPVEKKGSPRPPGGKSAT